VAEVAALQASALPLVLTSRKCTPTLSAPLRQARADYMTALLEEAKGVLEAQQADAAAGVSATCKRTGPFISVVASSSLRSLKLPLLLMHLRLAAAVEAGEKAQLALQDRHKEDLETLRSNAASLHAAALARTQRRIISQHSKRRVKSPPSERQRCKQNTQIGLPKLNPSLRVLLQLPRLTTTRRFDLSKIVTKFRWNRCVKQAQKR